LLIDLLKFYFVKNIFTKFLEDCFSVLKFEHHFLFMWKYKINSSLSDKISELNWAITLILIIGLHVSLPKGG